MSKLLSHLHKNHFSLIVELPENTISFAKAASEAGADAITIAFDPKEKDKKDIISIIRSSKIPVGGKVVGTLGKDELHALVMLGLDFVDFGLNFIDGINIKHDHIGRFAFLDPEYAIEDLTKLSEKPIDGIDAAIIARSDLGRELTVGDLQQYITISLSTGLPVIVPTQKMIHASEVPIVWDTGAKGILINKIVTGTKPETFSAAVEEYKMAVDSVNEQ